MYIEKVFHTKRTCTTDDTTGNVATEDLVYLFNRMGVEAGLDLSELLRTTAWLEEKLGKKLPGALPRAGSFPTM